MVDLFFDVNTTISSPPQDQLDLKRDIERVIFTLRKLFLSEQGVEDSKFRPYYVQAYNLATLGLVSSNAAPEVARRALDSLSSELVDSEGPAVKQAHLRRLALTALGLVLPCLSLYVMLRLAGQTACIAPVLKKLDIVVPQASGFMMLWVGCFVGVVLSYGWRSTKMTVSDLIVTDADYLSPLTRHLFAGTLTMIMGMLLSRGVVEVKIAGTSSAQIVTDPMIAFLVGTLFGVSELLLPGEVVKRAGAILGLKAG